MPRKKPGKACGADGCDGNSWANGLCNKHYKRMRRNGSLKALVRRTFTKEWFKSKIEIVDECWMWQGTTQKQGYGQVSVNGQLRLAHRQSYEIHFGPFDQKLCVLHRCDTPGCVNPDHLFLGTRADNAADRDKKGRTKTPKGEQCHLSVLTNDAVREIRASNEPYPRLAKRFGVSRTAIYNVKSGRTWRHVE